MPPTLVRDGALLRALCGASQVFRILKPDIQAAMEEIDNKYKYSEQITKVNLSLKEVYKINIRIYPL